MVSSTGDKLETNDKPHVAITEDKTNILPPPVADKPPPVADKSPLAPVRSRHKVGGISMLPVTKQMEEILSRKRLQTESALQKEPEDTHAFRSASVAKTPPVVKKKPVRAPLKSADFIDEDSKSSDLLSGTRSMENLVSACDEEETIESTNAGNDKLNKRISASFSVDDLKKLPPPSTASSKPPAVKARKLIPGAVKLITPMPRTGKVELTDENKATPADDTAATDNTTPTDDKPTDSATPTGDEDKEGSTVESPQPPDSPIDTTDAPPDDDKGETPGDNQPEDNQKQDNDRKQSEATGGSENIDILLLPEWNTDQVCVWLQRCGLGELATGIKLGNVTGKILMDLDSSKMKVGNMCVKQCKIYQSFATTLYLVRHNLYYFLAEPWDI